MRNWAGNLEFESRRIEKPRSVDEAADIVRGADRVRVFGSRHSFNRIADVPGGVHVSLENLNRIRTLDTNSASPAITFEAGMTYGQLAPVLHQAGWALPNLASLPHITVAGAVSTATHGSGVNNGSLSTSVNAIEFLTPIGDLKTVRRGDVDFDGSVVGLGSVGLVTALTLDLVPTYEIEQHVYLNTPIAAVADAYEALITSPYSISIFTTWQEQTFEQIWMKCRAEETHFDVRSLGGTPAMTAVHPIVAIPGLPAPVGIDPDKCTIQLGVPGPWHQRLPHFKLDHTPSSGEELQSEFFVGREHAKAAMEAVASLRDHLRPLIQISEIRVIAADSLWLSPYYKRPSVGFHFTWRRDPVGVAAVAKRLYKVLQPFAPRPHWAKVFPVEPARLEASYPKVSAFRELLIRNDPQGKFRNPFVSRCLALEDKTAT